MTLDIEEELAFAASTPGDGLDFNQFSDRIGDGFNDYGVRENTDPDGNIESVDVVFEAMEPGPPDRRNGVRITEDFLRDVAENSNDQVAPHLMDHAKRSSRAKIGDVQEVWFSDDLGKLMLMARVPNTGADVHDEAIARYTHDPPSWRDGSVGFGNSYEAVRNQDGEPELKTATLQEFSTVNFPGGYDEGGLRAAFADAAVEAVTEFDDPADDARKSGENSAADDSTFAVETETITF